MKTGNSVYWNIETPVTNSSFKSGVYFVGGGGGEGVGLENLLDGGP